jgi:hypothetical protein
LGDPEFRDMPFGTPIAARLTRLSRCGAVFWRVTVCELLGQILGRQPIAEAPATTTGGPSPRRSKAICVPSDEVTKLVTASSLRRSPEARAPYARFRRSAEQIDAESDRGDDGVVGSTSGTV